MSTGSNTEFGLVRIFCIRTEYGEVLPERYSVSLSINSKCGKIRIRKNSVFGHFRISRSGLSWLFSLCQFTISFRKCRQNLFVTKQMRKSDIIKGLYIYDDHSIDRWGVLKFFMFSDSIVFEQLIFCSSLQTLGVEVKNWSYFVDVIKRWPLI